MTFMKTPLLKLEMYHRLKVAVEDVEDAASEVEEAYTAVFNDDEELLEENLARLEETAERARDEGDTLKKLVMEAKAMARSRV